MALTPSATAHRPADSFENMSNDSARRLKMEAVGTGKTVEIIAKGKCRDYPCKVDGWRCPVCTKALSEAYREIIGDYYDSYQQDVEELKTRRRQVHQNIGIEVLST